MLPVLSPRARNGWTFPDRQAAGSSAPPRAAPQTRRGEENACPSHRDAAGDTQKQQAYRPTGKPSETVEARKPSLPSPVRQPPSLPRSPPGCEKPRALPTGKSAEPRGKGARRCSQLLSRARPAQLGLAVSAETSAAGRRA